MGKKTNKERKEQQLLLKKERAKQEKKRSLKILIATVSAILAVCLLISAGVLIGNAAYEAYLDSGNRYRNTVHFKTEHFEVNGAMLSFYFYDYLYSGTLETLGVDHPDELKEKFMSSSEENSQDRVSYFRYYNEVAGLKLQTDLLYAEVAVSEGITLSQQDQTAINNRLDSFEASAKALGMEEEDYIFMTYGRGVKLTDIEQILEIMALADKQYAKAYAGQTVSEEELRDYLAKNNQNFNKVDYYLHILTIPENATEEEKAEIRQKAEKLTACKSDEDFLKELRAQLTEEYGEDDGFDDKLLDQLVQNTILSEYVSTITEDTTDLDRFIHDPTRKNGDSYLSVGKKSYGVVRIARENYSIDVPLDTLRVLRLDFKNYKTKSDALNAFNTLKKDLSGKSEEEFISVVKSESEDQLTALLDGYYVMYDEGDTLYQLAANKLTDAKEGELIEVSNDDSVWLLYYCGKGASRSEVAAEQMLRAKKFNETVNDYADRYEMTYSTDKIHQVAPLT